MSRFAPDFRIEIDDEPVPAALRGCVTGVTFQNGLAGASRVEVAMANPDLRWLDHPLLEMDNKLTLYLGYAPAPLEKMFVGEITGVNATFSGGGMPTLTIVAHDFLHRLTAGSKDRAFNISEPCFSDFPLPDPHVAALISATNLLIPAIDPVGSALSFLTLLIAYAIDPLEAKRAIRVQRGQSDFDFLTRLAQENGWEMYIDHTQHPEGYVLRFKFLMQDYTPALSLTWGQSLLDFTPRLTTVGQVSGVGVCLWVPSIKMEFVLVLSWNFDRGSFDLRIFPGGKAAELLLGASSSATIMKIDGVSLVKAPQKIMAELIPRLNNRLTGSGSTMGDPRIRAGAVINFAGLGDNFSGLYRVTSATHSLNGGGYRTSFEVRKEVWFGSFPLPQGADSLVRLQGQFFG